MKIIKWLLIIIGLGLIFGFFGLFQALPKNFTYKDNDQKVLSFKKPFGGSYHVSKTNTTTVYWINNCIQILLDTDCQYNVAYRITITPNNMSEQQALANYIKEAELNGVYYQSPQVIILNNQKAYKLSGTTLKGSEIIHSKILVILKNYQIEIDGGRQDTDFQKNIINSLRFY